MNLTVIVLEIILPAIIAYIAMTLAMTCKYHPFTRAVIIPDDPSKVSDASQISDLNTRHKWLVAIAIGVGLAVVLSLFLLASLNTGLTNAAAGSLLKTFDGLSQNERVIAVVVFVIIGTAPYLIRSFAWMTLSRGIVMIAVYASIFAIWLTVDSWLTLNLMTGTVCVIAALVLQQRISFLRFSLIMLLVAIFYDAWQVYSTGNMTEVVSSSLPTLGSPERQLAYPKLLLFPDDLLSTPRFYGILGAGDVLVFSLLAIAAARFAKKIGSRMPVVAVFAGFAVAITVCSLVGIYFRSGQPATIYIVPLCTLPVILYAKWRGNFDQLSVPFYDRPAKSFWKM